MAVLALFLLLLEQGSFMPVAVEVAAMEPLPMYREAEMAAQVAVAAERRGLEMAGLQ